MALSSTHPLYDDLLDRWTLCRDCYEGEDAIKDKGTTYLPATAGQREDGMESGGDGLADYTDYKARAVVPELFKPAVEAMVGIIHKNSWVIELPPQLEAMRKKCTLDGEGIESLLRRINEEQLVAGRIGVLLDVPDNAPPNSLPFFATYAAESILNWADATGEDGKSEPALVVLDESGQDMDSSLQWKDFTQFRVIAMSTFAKELFGDAIDTVKSAPDGTYITATVETEELPVDAEFVAPALGGRTMPGLPFKFIGTKDTVSDPDVPPCIGIARATMTIYRTEADYRHTLHLQGQETLVVIGNTDSTPKRVGANRFIGVPIQGDAKMVGASHESLEAFVNCIKLDESRASNLGANMLVQKGADAESGDALKIRVAAKTATLGSIAKTSAEAIEQLLKMAAVLRGADPNKVSVKPNMDFADESIEGADVVQWMTARSLGAPISLQTIHENLRLAGKTRLTYEEETDIIEDEGPTGAPNGDPRGTPPDDEDPDTKPGRKPPARGTRKTPAPRGEDGPA
jgi:hypothetical protein